MIIISIIISLIGLLLSLAGFIGLYKHRANIFGSVSINDIKDLNKKLSEAADANNTGLTDDILKKVARANDFFICIVVGFILEFIAVALLLYTIIYQPFILVN